MKLDRINGSYGSFGHQLISVEETQLLDIAEELGVALVVTSLTRH